MTRSLRALLIIGMLSLLGGCQSAELNAIDMNAQGDTADITINNRGLQEELSISSGRVLYEGDILVASVTVRSNEPERLLLDYRFQWYDADDLKLITGSGEHWERVFIDGGEEEQVVGRATRPGATRSVFQIRYHQGSSAGN